MVNKPQKDPGLYSINLLALQVPLGEIVVGQETQEKFAIHTGVCVRENKTFSEPVLLLWIHYFYEYKRTLCINFFRIFDCKSLQ